MSNPEDILKFWLDDCGPKAWYTASDALDAEIRDRFGAAWAGAMEGRFGLWLTYPSGALAYIILTDQFSRNMFRGTGQAFASDHIALAAAKQAIARAWDTRIDPPARQFFYMPLMHSESLADQECCIRQYMQNMPANGPDHLLHAQAHRQVIRQFGRFPYRNEALSRRSTTSETAYLQAGGYGHTLRSLQAQMQPRSQAS
ncbi:MAG: DUF924 family protein [Paracoccaceae bacterium]